jgi:hypothetical protein
MSPARRTLQVFAFVGTLMVGVASMAAIVTQTTWFKDWLRGFIVRQAAPYVNGQLSIGSLGGNLFFGIELEKVDITVNGQTVVGIKDVGLDYNGFSFISGGVVLDDIRLNKPVIRLIRAADGSWNLAHLFKARTPDPDQSKNRRPIEIGEVGISDGTIHIDDRGARIGGVDLPARIEKLDASLGVTSNEDELTVDLNHVSLRAADPALGINDLSGVIRRTPNELTLRKVTLTTEESTLKVDGRIRNIEGSRRILDLATSSEKLALAEFAALVPALAGYPLQPAFDARITGPIDDLAVDLNARETSLGRTNASLKVDVEGPERRIAGTVNVEHFNVASVLRNGGPASMQSDITGQAKIDLTLPYDGKPLRGTYATTASDVLIAGYRAANVAADGRIDGRVVQVKNAHANGYGGQFTGAGTVLIGSPVTLDLQGHATNVDMRNLPAQLRMPGVPSRLQFDYTLAVRGREFSGDVQLDESMLAGATIATGTTGHFRLGAGAPEYAAKGQVTGLDVQQVGRGFSIQAIAPDKYKSRLNATFDITGSGGGRDPLTLDATGTAVDSEIFGARFPTMNFTAQFAGGDAHIRSAGQFVDLDPSVPTGNMRLAGNLTGDIDAETTLRGYASGVTVDSIDVAGRINLQRSSLGELVIDTAAVDGRYANRQGELTTLTMTGPDVNVTGNGVIALGDTGASKLTLHADTASLDRIGRIIGQPLKGTAAVDATVTGNGRELTAQGTLKGSSIGYGDNAEALSLNSEFTASMPNLTPADATVQARSTVTFLEIGGQKVNELTADTTYAMKALQFNGTAKEGVRELQAAGRAVFHPDHQEVHLSNISLRAEQVQWQTAPGSEATVNYAKGRIAVEKLQLVSGDQSILAEGVIGSPTESLQFKATNVDVALLDQLLLGDQRLTGRLTATGAVTGTLGGERSAGQGGAGQGGGLRVEGTFGLAQGSFRMFRFESLGGTVNYAGQGLTMDVRLQQTPTAWLTAKGAAPLSLFRPTPPEAKGVHAEAPPGEAIDLQIASSQVDLGVIQGFTSYVTNVAGVLQANVRVTGSGDDPHFNGNIDIRGGAFAVPDLGTTYTGLDTRIDLTPAGVSITEFKILDKRGAAMTVGGTLATHAGDIGAVNIMVTSDTFEVINNELANLKLNARLQVTGELRKPKVVGAIEIDSGTIFVQRVLEQLGGGPYALDAAEFGTAKPATGPPTVFQALEMDLGLVVPSNLVIRGDDLQPGNLAVSVGDINLTVGGSVQLRKAPGADIRVLGEVNTVRGTYSFQGRRFDVLRDGRLRFDGGETIDPIIDIRARRVISGVETFVRVQGTMYQPELTFSSNPPLDQADILSLIVFNQPINELGEGEQVNLAERAGAIASGYLTASLARSIGSVLTLDEFEIQAGGESGVAGSLTVGEQVGEKLFVRIRQAFGDAQATELILEYQLADYLRLQATAAETSSGTQRVRFRRVERGGIDLIFFFSY